MTTWCCKWQAENPYTWAMTLRCHPFAPLLPEQILSLLVYFYFHLQVPFSNHSPDNTEFTDVHKPEILPNSTKAKDTAAALGTEQDRAAWAITLTYTCGGTGQSGRMHDLECRTRERVMQGSSGTISYSHSQATRPTSHRISHGSPLSA